MKRNGSDTTPPPSPGGAGQKSRLRRTLFTAGVFALLAMIYVPTPRERGVHSAGYRFIFSGEDTSIAFFQLLVNVAFAALLGVILSNIRWRWQRKPTIEKPRPKKPTQDRVGAVIFLIAAGVVVTLAILLTLKDAARVQNRPKETETSPPPSPIPRALPVEPVRTNEGARNPFDEIERLDAEYKDAVERGDLGAVMRAEAKLRALGINPAKRK